MSRRRLVGIAFVALNACRDEPEPPPIVWEGDLVRYRADEEHAGEVCEGTFQYLDAQALHLFGVFRRESRALDFSYLPAGTGPFCREHALGCTVEGHAFTTEAVHVHELVHAVRTDSLAFRALEEGAAEAFGDDWSLAPITGDLLEILETRSRDSLLLGEEYPRLGHFVSYLAAEYGAEDAVALLDETSLSGDFGSVELASESVLGESIQSIASRYASDYPECEAPRFRDDAVECSGQPLDLPVAEGAETMARFEIDCADSDTVGPRLGEVWRNVVLRAPRRARYQVDLTSSSGTATMRLTECGRSCFATDELSFETTGLIGPLCLDATDYLLRISIPEGATDEVSLGVSYVGESGCT